MQNATYHRLSNHEREEISRALGAGSSANDIARRLDRSASTITREIRRNGGTAKYRAFLATGRARRHAALRKLGKRKLLAYPSLYTYVMEKLALRWSPEQIAVMLRREYPRDARMRISPEAIYQYIYVLPRGELKRELIRSLRQERGWRRKRGNRTERRGKIADMLSIEERPADVAARTIPGHWEGDLLEGKRRQSAIGTLVERTTRFTLLVPLKEKNVTSVRKAYATALRTLPRHLKQSLTYDQGKEMSEHTQFSIDTGITVYFAHPASPWERGTNENTNGLIRQFFPRGTDFNTVSRAELKRVQDLLNTRPRKVLNFELPQQAFTRLVALDS